MKILMYICEHSCFLYIFESCVSINNVFYYCSWWTWKYTVKLQAMCFTLNRVFNNYNILTNMVTMCYSMDYHFTVSILYLPNIRLYLYFIITLSYYFLHAILLKKYVTSFQNFYIDRVFIDAPPKCVFQNVL